MKEVNKRFPNSKRQQRKYVAKTTKIVRRTFFFHSSCHCYVLLFFVDHAYLLALSFGFLHLPRIVLVLFPARNTYFFRVRSKKERERARTKNCTQRLKCIFLSLLWFLLPLSGRISKRPNASVCVCVRLVCFILCANAQAEQNVCLSTLFGSIFWLAFSCNLTVCCWSFALVHLIAHNVFRVHFCERMFWFPF